MTNGERRQLHKDGRSRLTREVARVARNARGLRLIGSCATTMSVVVVSVLTATLLDALFRFPWFVRAGFLCAIVALLVLHFRKRIVPAWKFRPTPVDLALRIERYRPELLGRLASAVEFDLLGVVQSSRLAARALSDAEERAVGADLASILRKGPALRRSALLLTCVCVSIWVASIHPVSTSIALQRLFVPILDVRWPSRTSLVSLIEKDGVAAKGRPFALRARLTEGDTQKERIRAVYRFLPTLSEDGKMIDAHGESAWTEVVLARQPSGDFERIIDTSGDALEVRFLTSDAETDLVRVRMVEPPAVREAFLKVQPPKYAEHVVAIRNEELGTGLDPRSVVREPVLRGSTVELSVRLNRALPSGSDQTSVHVFVDGVQVIGMPRTDASSKEVGGSNEAVRADDRTPTEAPAVTAATSATAPFRIVVDEQDAARWTISGVADGATRIELQLVDEFGIAHDETLAYIFDVTDDRVPTVTIVDPATDESMVLDAKVPVRVESRDDLALEGVGVEIIVELAAEVSGSQNSDASDSRGLQFEEGRDLGANQVGAEHANREGATTSARGKNITLAADFETTIDLGKLSVRAGDRVVIRGFAKDGFAKDGFAKDRFAKDDFPEDGSLGDVRRSATSDSTGRVNTQSSRREVGRVRSAPRIIRIVGEDEFERQVRAMLGGVRREAMRADERQARAREALERDARDPSVQEAQGSLTESLARLEETTREAIERLKRNGRDEGLVGELATQALELSETARARSSESSAALREATQAKDNQGGDTASRTSEAEKNELERKAIERAKTAQDEVRKELEDLVALLDRDEDAWMARRRLDALADRVRQSARETGQAAARSNGETREELSPEARAEIDDLAERQRALSSEAEQLAAELRERAKSLEEADAKQAQALEQAAKAMEDGRARDELAQAAEAAQENRLEQSKAAQDRAAAALAQASESLSENRKVRAEELARVLEELTDSIKSLIRQTEPIEAEVKLVTDAAGETAEIERDVVARQAGKVSQNARGVAQDARATSREAARAARFVEDGGKSLAGAATGLRAELFLRDDVGSEISAALKAFGDALTAAEQATDRAEQRANEEKKEELLAKYRGLLERQVGVKASTEKLIRVDGGQLGRRESIESRRLGLTQDELRQAIAEIPKQEPAVKDTDALAELHDLMDVALSEARTALAEAKPANALEPESEVIEALSFIVESLDESGEQPDADEFAEQQQSAEGGEGGGEGPQQGPIPPVAEIKILRSMQRALAERTKAVAERGATANETELRQAVAELAARQQRIIELATKIAEKLGGQRGDNPGVKAGSGGVEPAEQPGSKEGTQQGDGDGTMKVPTSPKETKP